MDRALWVALLCLVGCGGDDPQRRELVDEGEVCLRLQPSGLLQVNVVFRDCLRSCDVAGPATCGVERDGAGSRVLRITSHGTVTSEDNGYCLAFCGQLRATCVSSEPVPPGTWQVRHGAEQGQLTLGTQPQCLFQDPSAP